MSNAHQVRRRVMIGGLVAVIVAGGAWLYYVARPVRVAVNTPLYTDLSRVTGALEGDARFVNVDVQISPDGATILMGGEVPDAAALADLRSRVDGAGIGSPVEWRVEVVR